MRSKIPEDSTQARQDARREFSTLLTRLIDGKHPASKTPTARRHLATVMGIQPDALAKYERAHEKSGALPTSEGFDYLLEGLGLALVSVAGDADADAAARTSARQALTELWDRGGGGKRTRRAAVPTASELDLALREMREPRLKVVLRRDGAGDELDGVDTEEFESADDVPIELRPQDKLRFQLTTRPGHRIFVACGSTDGWQQIVPGARHDGHVLDRHEHVPTAGRGPIGFAHSHGKHVFVFVETPDALELGRPLGAKLADALHPGELADIVTALHAAPRNTWRWGQVRAEVA